MIEQSGDGKAVTQQFPPKLGPKANLRCGRLLV
jgi:hypothetical protein